MCASDDNNMSSVQHSSTCSMCAPRLSLSLPRPGPVIVSKARPSMGSTGRPPMCLPEPGCLCAPSSTLGLAARHAPPRSARTRSTRGATYVLVLRAPPGAQLADDVAPSTRGAQRRTAPGGLAAPGQRQLPTRQRRNRRPAELNAFVGRDDAGAGLLGQRHAIGERERSGRGLRISAPTKDPLLAKASSLLPSPAQGPRDQTARSSGDFRPPRTRSV